MTISFWAEARKSFHAALFESVLVTDKNNVPSNADKHSPHSVEISRDTVKQLKYEDAASMLDTLIRGKRLRDVSDLPFDLVV